jgi:hypothetical protein
VTTHTISALSAVSPPTWDLPNKGLSVFHGSPETLRLFHYFLPRAILQGKQVLCLDGANRFDPLLIARFARERKLDPSEFGRRIRIARAFTCFQLTELLVRLPLLLRAFPAQIAIVTALPDLFFDEDVREREAIASFQRALQALKAAPLPVAVFTAANSSHSSRRPLFQQVIAEADHVFRFAESAGPALPSRKSAPASLKA